MTCKPQGLVRTAPRWVEQRGRHPRCSAHPRLESSLSPHDGLPTRVAFSAFRASSRNAGQSGSTRSNGSRPSLCPRQSGPASAGLTGRPSRGETSLLEAPKAKNASWDPAQRP
jgi:hypothetical protein